MSVVNKNYFYVFIQAMGFFCNITERQISVGEGDGNSLMYLFPAYERIITKVNETIISCNGTLADRSNWPTPTDIKAMIPSLFYGENSKNLYPLQLDVAPQFLNSSFIRCFNDTIGPWAKSEINAIDQGTHLLVGILITVTLLALAAYGLYRAHAQSSSRPRNLFAVQNTSSSEEQDRLLDSRHSVHV